MKSLKFIHWVYCINKCEPDNICKFDLYIPYMNIIIYINIKVSDSGESILLICILLLFKLRFAYLLCRFPIAPLECACLFIVYPVKLKNDLYFKC